MNSAVAALFGAFMMALAVGASPPQQASPSPLPAATELSPDDIFHRAVQVTGDHVTPPFITYTLHEIFIHHGKRSEYDYRVWYRGDGKALMQNVSPDRRGRAETFWGYPFPAAPDINFLLYATPPPLRTVPSPRPVPSGSGPPVLDIEPVTADRYYDIALLGIELYNGHPVYHLKLHAVREQYDKPLNELWIDIQTFEVWKALLARSGQRGLAYGSGYAYGEFVPIGRYWLVSHAGGSGQVRVGFVSDSGDYEFFYGDFGFPDYIPDWYFDAKAFGQHRR